jgi:hypothetical protein
MSETQLEAPAHDPRVRTDQSLGTTQRDEHHDAPRLEPWLKVSLLAILPMLVAFALPKEHVPFAAAISGILLAIGVGMLIVQERRRR